MAKELFTIQRRWSWGAALRVEIDCDSATPAGPKLGLAVKAAYSTGADLRGADLTGADLKGADLINAAGIISGGRPDGWLAYGWLRDGWLSVRVGCREMRLAEGRAYWAGKDSRREVLAALDHIEAVARQRGWLVDPVA